MMREEIFLDGINCEPFSFTQECEEHNRRYEVYRHWRRERPEDCVVLHHFILVFNSTKEQGLSGEKAQKIALKFAERCLPGFQILVCTHTDTFSGQGQCHTHLYVNNRRYKDDGPDLNGQHLPGMKLQTSRPMIRDMQRILLDLCHEEGLLYETLPVRTNDRISSREFWAQKKGQARLDRKNEQIRAEGGTPWSETFKTKNMKLRETISEVAAASATEEEFRKGLEERGISVEEKDGRWSFSRPGGEGFISAYKLGDSYLKGSILDRLGAPLTEHKEPWKEAEDYALPAPKEEPDIGEPVPSPIRHRDLER